MPPSPDMRATAGGVNLSGPGTVIGITVVLLLMRCLLCGGTMHTVPRHCAHCVHP